LAGVGSELSNVEYRCPGEDYTISRAVHLARLAGYYDACRECAHRSDTAGLSARQVRRLAEIDALPRHRPLLAAEGIRDAAINDVTPHLARTIAAEFARRLQGSRHAPRAVRQSGSETPRTVVFAGDGRLSTAAIVAAVAEGICWTGCEAVDLGAASAPCLAMAIGRMAADGGIYVGNSSGAAHTVGIKFWVGGKPLSQSELFDTAAGCNVFGTLRLPPDYGTRSVPGTLDRPSRSFGPLRRMNAAEDYLNELRPAYHGLRPLRFVLQCGCVPVVTYLHELLQNVACRAIPAEPGGDFGGQIVGAKAHFGMVITDDGENALVYGERGRTMAADRMTGLLTDSEQVPVADALRTLTLLLVLLSRDDLPFSAVLDRVMAKR
jgi:phosphomannomutase